MAIMGFSHPSGNSEMLYAFFTINVDSGFTSFGYGLYNFYLPVLDAAGRISEISLLSLMSFSSKYSFAHVRAIKSNLSLRFIF